MASLAMKSVRVFGSTLACVAVAAACSHPHSSSGTAPLPNPLGASTEVVSQVQKSVPDLTQLQTANGMGGILFYAQSQMQPADFKQVASAFPGSDNLIRQGSKLGMPSEMTGLTSLSGSLKNAGVSQDQFQKMVPAMTDIVSKKSGADAAQKFAAVFKP
jgi:Protein of unknown function VcgC/VcgE (DUF2780)